MLSIMNISSGNTKFENRLQPLFEAMKSGKTIKEVVIMNGAINKDDRTQDVLICNFVATHYTCGLESHPQKKFEFDFVRTNKEGFYMNWVVSFLVV